MHVDDSTEETGLDELVTAVRTYLERRYDKAIVTQTITEYFHSWDDVIDLSVSPAVSITSIKYYDSDDNLQPLASSNYHLVANRIEGYVCFDESMSYPQLHQKPNCIEVEYVCGFAVASIPANIKQHIRMCVARLYYEKEAFAEVLANNELMFPELSIEV